jgi:hypothetical protein
MKKLLLCLAISLVLLTSCTQRDVTPTPSLSQEQYSQALQKEIKEMEEKEAQYKLIVDGYVKEGYYSKADKPPDIWVTTLFYDLLFQEKEKQLEDIYSYYKSIDPVNADFLILRDWKSGIEVGYYSYSFEVKLTMESPCPINDESQED